MPPPVVYCEGAAVLPPALLLLLQSDRVLLVAGDREYLTGIGVV